MANFTKQAIKAAFLELLDEKPLNKISVRDIVERCGINRNSFYYHFQDIPSLLGEIIVEWTNELMAQYPTVDRIEEAFRASIDYAQKNRRAIMHVYNSVSRDTFEASVMRLCAYMTEQYLKSAATCTEKAVYYKRATARCCTGSSSVSSLALVSTGCSAA